MTSTAIETLRAARPAFERAQTAGPLSMVPVFGATDERFAPPQSSVKLARVHTYGKVELEARVPPRPGSATRAPIVIVPLHLGYVQDGAQNHALARAHLMLDQQHYVFEDAFCVQQGQGGLLEGQGQVFFILPQQLREKALSLRGNVGFNRLWGSIAQLCATFGLEQHGHLEQIINRQRPYLTQFASRFEALRGQTGALFFHHDRLVGVELAPNERFFAEVFQPLVTFSYGPLAFLEEVRGAAAESPVTPFAGTTLEAIRASMLAEREARTRPLAEEFNRVAANEWSDAQEEELLGVTLHTVGSRHLVGQVVREEGRAVYASLTRRLAA
jgi:hypothetical protein